MWYYIVYKIYEKGELEVGMGEGGGGLMKKWECSWDLFHHFG